VSMGMGMGMEIVEPLGMVARIQSIRLAWNKGVLWHVCRNSLASRAHKGVRSGGGTGRSVCSLSTVSIISTLSIISTVSIPLALPALAAEPVPAWQVGEASIRSVFTRGAQDAFALCVIPAAAGGQPVAAVKAESGGALRPVRVVWADGSRVHVLVDCQGLAENAVVAVYGMAGERRVVPEPQGLVDPAPIRVAARHTVGQDPPATFDDLKRLVVRPGNPSAFFAFPGFDVIAAGIGKYAKGAGWDRPLSLLRLTTWIVVPQDGLYVFALTGDNAAWLRIDGEEVVGQAYSLGRPSSRECPPLILSAGLHRLIVDTAVRTTYSLDVLWRAADTNTLLPTLVTGGALTEGRLERREDDLHVFARAQLGLPYRFQGVPAHFCPVTLQDESVCWSGGDLTYAWQINGIPVGHDRRVETVLVATNPVAFVAELTVRRATDGVSGSASIILPDEGVSAAEYRISSALIGAPAVCYGEDPVVPEIHVRATSPDATAFALRAVVIGSDGSQSITETPLILVRSWGRVALPRGVADSFREIRWQVLHAGVSVDGGRWVFDVPPFESLPDGVDGVSLRRGGSGVTLIARRASRGETAEFKGLRRGQRLLFLDGFMVSAGLADRVPAEDMDRALANGPAGVSVAYQRIGLQTLEATDDPRGGARLAPLASLRGLLPVDVSILAPDLSGARDGETPEIFERRLAGFAGALTEAGKTQVILVVPPAFDVLPGCGCAPGRTPCAHARAGRLYAEIVYRVADAYGLTVADLYTPFELDGDDQPLIVGGVLTPRGMRKAAEVFRRVLYPTDR